MNFFHSYENKFEGLKIQPSFVAFTFYRKDTEREREREREKGEFNQKEKSNVEESYKSLRLGRNV